MTTTAPTPATTRAPMDPLRKTALVAGGLYLVSFLAIFTLTLYGPVHDPGYILGPGPDTALLWGGLVEVIVALACIGTAVALFPVVKRQNEGIALGFVAARVLEATVIFIGVVSLLSIVTLRQDLAGADPASLLTTGATLVAFHDWTFLLGQAVIPGVNGLLLGYLLYRSGLVPRVIPLMGLIGAPLLLASSTATLFGVYDQVSLWSGIATIPIFLWELSLGVWLVVKGFRPSPITAAVPATSAPPAYRNAAA